MLPCGAGLQLAAELEQLRRLQIGAQAASLPHFFLLYKTRPAYNISMPDEAPLSFEAGLQQLEAIVKEMEGGDLPLERALELFERGMKLSDTCRKQLEEAETRVEILMRRAGEMQPQPFGADKRNDKN
jgi:exodeoxyribonuclease VII small subunit